MKTTVSAIFIILAFALIERHGRADGTLVNAGFSNPQVFGVQTFYGSSQIPGWTITNGSVDVVNLASQPYYVDNFQGDAQGADLNGYTGYTPQCAATIYQDVNTTPGDSYTYTFGIAANTAGAPSVKSMEIFWGNSNSQLSLVGVYESSIAAFTTYSFTVQAQSSESRLELVSTTDTYSSYGPYVDFNANPVVVPTPEPSMWIFLIFGAAAIVLFVRLKPKKSADAFSP